MNFILRRRTNLFGRNLGHGDRSSIERGKLDHEAFRIFERVNDCAHITNGETVFRQINS